MSVLNDIEWYSYGKRYWYPHMGKADAEIWERFLARYPEMFVQCAYDVPVGRGLAIEEFEAVGLPSTQNKLYQRRIDVLAKVNGIYTIVEVKPRASTSAIGQIKGYATLFRRDYDYSGPLLLLIVTDQLMPEMEFLAKNEGLNLLVV